MTGAHVKAMLPEEVAGFVADLGEKSFRAKQILHWVYKKRVLHWADMSNLPAGLRNRLEERAPLSPLTAGDAATSSDGTVKALFQTGDHHLIEAVWMPRDGFRTVCASSQAGCALGCAFCATGKGGFFRNLAPEEIVDQVLQLGRRHPDGPSHVVFMGMGEPLMNLDGLVRAIRLLTHPLALGMSPTRITVSTAGVVDGMERLAQEKLKINLALSLNATTQTDRARLMPGAARTELTDLLEVFARFPDTRRDRKTIEYVLLEGENDTSEDARRLAAMAWKTRAKVNLIPFNALPEMSFSSPPETIVQAFLRTLSASGVTATVRRSRGADICAACGQLAGRKTRKER